MVNSFLMEIITQPSGSRTVKVVLGTLWKDINQYSSYVFRLAIPAALYALQNNLNYFALKHINAVSFQVIQQLKILTTASFAVALLGKRMNWRHWGSLLLLVLGVCVVQVANLQDVASYSHDHNRNITNAWWGFAAMVINSLSSGFAGIYFERLIKTFTPKPALNNTRRKSGLNTESPNFVVTGTRSVWIQSIELGFFGLLFSLIPVLSGSNLQRIRTQGFFVGFDLLTLLVIAIQALGGILVTLVLKYADSILKAFSTSTSIVLSASVTYFIMGQTFSLSVITGAILVGLALYFYSLADRLEESAVLTSKNHEK